MEQEKSEEPIVPMIIETTKLYIGKGLYFREANMKDRTTYIDANLLVSPSSAMTDEQVRVFQRKLYIRAKQDKDFKTSRLIV